MLFLTKGDKSHGYLIQQVLMIYPSKFTLRMQALVFSMVPIAQSIQPQYLATLQVTLCGIITFLCNRRLASENHTTLVKHLTSSISLIYSHMSCQHLNKMKIRLNQKSKTCVNIKILMLDALGTSTTARNKGHLFYYPSLLNVPLSTLASLNLS